MEMPFTKLMKTVSHARERKGKKKERFPADRRTTEKRRQHKTAAGRKTGLLQK